ncbi:MAG: hypothetical protein OQL11_07950 [Gammaproteobacteria bacterium]|nr:hypothetical protein [Gammaproteobacteria bacterium]
MLDHILRQVQSYTRTHGAAPNAVLISAEHLQILQDLYPRLFDRDPQLELGFRFIVVPGSESPHPRAAHVPERRSSLQRNAA